MQIRALSLTATLIVATVAPTQAQAWDWQTSTSIWRLLGWNIELTGRDLNGTDLNNKLLDGRQVIGVSLSGATVNGLTAKQVTLKKTRFSGTSIWGHALGHGDFAKAHFAATLDDASTLPLRVVGAVRHADKVHKDVWLYEVQYLTKSGWKPLCGLDDAGQPLRAIPLTGRWNHETGVTGGGDHIDDPGAFTFGCEDHVLAKCVLEGYKPWRQALVCNKGQGCSKFSLADHHQACTRMLRADYCGNGTSYTVDDVAINVYDGLGVRADSEAWATEAEWDADGAICLSAPRISASQPTCAGTLQRSLCGDKAAFAGDALLISEFSATP